MINFSQKMHQNATELKLETRKQQQISNAISLEQAQAGIQFQVDDLKKKHLGATHRTNAPCTTYNCHGLTFASRRTAISDSKEIAKILHDDGYIVVEPTKVLPGDIVVYYRDGAADHSGIVTEIGGMAPKILSKWGYCHEVVHFLNDCPYETKDVKYYRIVS
ncbi:hypothetical protein [Thalassospira xiamenensis]|uniref:hypothetical protein n=1 Tax=Thalassospira xiamenensis TaxID=220697 RepID=UPI000DEDFBEE|nr:hypothetical protein [Thalassospira xiamenensis]RCK40015.1 hypothetical protein TH24_11660 [Thalassospira xiamenensis]